MMLQNNFYKILEKENLIVEFFSGIVTIDSIIKFKQNLIQDPKFSLDYHYYICFKNVTFDIEKQEISKYIDFSNKYLQPNKHRKVAIITDTPNQVALTTLFKMQSEHPLQKVEIFSTTKSALHWLGKDATIFNKFNFNKKCI
ncbi:MAG: hypothetical protein L3J60_10090 [Lutibacter sp.]|nr:hypothetical protein [Lutibacter sp.]